MMSHHPFASPEVDRYHAIIIVQCDHHGSHALHLDADDDMAWLVARNLKSYFEREKMKATVAEWSTFDAADDDALLSGDTFATTLGEWPE